MNSEAIQNLICRESFSGAAVTLVGFGAMGREYFKTLKSLGVRNVRIVSRSAKEGVTFSGGFEKFRETSRENESVILAVPVPELIPAAEHFRELGFRRFLIEKPLSLYSGELERFWENFSGSGIEAFVAYNRVVYPSLLEAAFRADREGGITSCQYAFTERIDRVPQTHSPEVLRRWGMANSSHVIGMAHRLIGLPKEWKSYRAGNAVPWHPAGSLFSGAGATERGILFNYHADWSSTGRWSVEIHTAKSSYRLCPLEKLFRRTVFGGPWEEIETELFDPALKAGFAEQTAAFLSPEIRKGIPLVSVAESLTLSRYVENVFGYPSH